MESANPLVSAVAPLLANDEVDWDAVLEQLTSHCDCPVGTVHLMDATGMLKLTAHRGLPPPVVEKVAVIPVGKGMAGIAAERKEPVQVCNLQTDDSGVVRPGAKLTQMEGSIAVPMMAGPDESQVVGVLGVAKPVAYEFTQEQADTLMAVGRRLARKIQG